MLRKFLVVLFILLALIAPVWIPPVRRGRDQASRPAATGMEIVRKGKRS